MPSTGEPRMARASWISLALRKSGRDACIPCHPVGGVGEASDLMAGHELDLAVPEMANTPPKGRRTRRFPTAAFVGPTLPRADQPAYGVRIMGKWSWRWASCFAFVLAACAPQAPSATPPPLPPPAASQSPAAVAVAPAPGPESSVSALGIAAAAPRAARSSAPVPL